MYPQSEAIVIIVVVLSFISTFAVVLRFCAQHEIRQRRGWKADEYMIIAALVRLIFEMSLTAPTCSNPSPVSYHCYCDPGDSWCCYRWTWGTV